MPTQEVLVSQKFNNYNYAPGIATYGIDGKTGASGLDGNNIYFTDFNIKQNDELRALTDQIVQSYMPIKGSTVKNTRQYQNGDLFFDQHGIIYKLNDIDTLIEEKEHIQSWITYFSIAGQIGIADTSDNFLTKNGRLVLNSSDYTGFDIFSGTTYNPTYIDSTAVVNIVSNVVDENDNIEMVKMQSIDDVDIEDGKLKVYYKTTNNAYYLDSNSPIVINADIKVNNINAIPEFDDYSTVLTSDDTISYFKHICDNLIYNVIYDNDVNKFKLVIYQNNGGTDMLEYLINRNDTVFGKIYTNENDQVLVKLNNIINGSVGTTDYIYQNTPYDCNIHTDEVNTVMLYDQNNIQKVITDNNINVDYSHDTYFNKSDVSISFNVYPEEIGNFTIITNNNKVKESYQITTSNICKYTFNATNNLALQLQPVGKYICDNNDSFTYPPINLPFDNINNILTNNSEYTLYFKINYNNHLLSINDIMIFDSNNMLTIANLDTSVAHIQTYLPDSINSVQKFSLLHNTEVFLHNKEE